MLLAVIPLFFMVLGSAAGSFEECVPLVPVVVALAFGDGFSNVFYPTNPVLLISLGLVGVSYGSWVKWSTKFQILNILLTSGLLLFGLAIGYC